MTYKQLCDAMQTGEIVYLKIGVDVHIGVVVGIKPRYHCLQRLTDVSDWTVELQPKGNGPNREVYVKTA